MSTIITDSVPEFVEPMGNGQWYSIIRLLHTAHISEARRDMIEKDVDGFTQEEASLCIEYLKMNQPVDFVKELGREARKISATASNELKG